MKKFEEMPLAECEKRINFALYSSPVHSLPGRECIVFTDSHERFCFAIMHRGAARALVLSRAYLFTREGLEHAFNWPSPMPRAVAKSAMACWQQP